MIHWNLKGLSVEIHWCGCQRDRQMGNRAEVTCHRLLPSQQLQFDEVMTKELSQVWAADAVRRLSQEEGLNLEPESLLRMRWVLTWKYTEGGDRKAKARLVIFGVSASRADQCVPTAAPTLEKDVSSFDHYKHAHCSSFVSILVTSPRLSCKTSASEEHQELTIKAPPEVGYSFSDSEGKLAR